MKQTTKTFSLVPSARTKSDIAAPISVLPAIPVLLPHFGNINTLGIIDTGASISCISEKIVKNTRFNSVVAKGIIKINMAGSLMPVPTIITDLIFADENFEPWLRIDNITFAVLTSSRGASGAASITLGYSGCLEHLAVFFDFPKRLVSISAPAEFGLKHSKDQEPVQPGRLREAELLARIGSYDSAIVMAAAAVEELLRATWPESPGGSRPLPLSRFREHLPFELQPLFASILQMRNEAVHGVGGRRFTKDQADQVIHDGWQLVRFLLKQQLMSKS